MSFLRRKPADEPAAEPVVEPTPEPPADGKKGRPTPKAPQNRGRTSGAGGRPRGVSQAEWDWQVEASRMAAAARQAETTAKLEQGRSEVPAPPPSDLRARLRRPKDEAGPGP